MWGFAAAAIAAFVLATPAPVVVTPDTVDLGGAGELEFEQPDENDFHIAVPPGGDAVELVVRLWFNPAGKPLSCDIGLATPAAEARTACALLLESAQFHLSPEFSLRLRRGFVDVRFSFGYDASDQITTVHAAAIPGYRNVAIHYPVLEIPDTALFRHDMLRPGPFISPDDYPLAAMLDDADSQTEVLIGIASNGNVRTCVPYGQSDAIRTAWLDNLTCQLALRRLHYAIAPAFAQYQGLKYYRQSVRWLVPKD